ncbi:flagellin N-terminal helical domain-containing protein [Vreelandella sp. EE22]
MSAIHTNLMSMTGQTNLKRSQSALATSMERLSTGLRVNSAKDDAAGQAIGNRMTSQINGRAMAMRNANDGVSLSQTAQGVLESVNNNLQRIRELTVQGLSEIYNGEMGDRIQAEINLNLKEIDRLSRTTEFNGIPLLDGTAGKIPLQVGANDGETININLGQPGFSVDALNLKDFTFQGEPGTISHIDTLSGSASRIPIDDATYSSVNYVPEENEPHLVRFGGSDVIQLGGEGGQLQNVSVSARHDTDTRNNRVTISVREAATERTSSETINSLTFLNEEGGAWPSGSTRLVGSGGQYWIEDTRAGEPHYTPARLSMDNSQRSVVAQALDEPTMSSGDLPRNISEVRYMPSVSKQSSQYSLTLDGQDESASDRIELVRLGSTYYVEEQLDSGDYAYYSASVTSETGGEEDIFTVVSERGAMGPVTDQPYVSGSSTVHLKPSNNNVQVNYRELNGTTHRDVMGRDPDNGYVFNLNAFEDGSGAYKTANLVTNQDNETLLQTVNGNGEVILYYPLSRSVRTDVDSNLTTVTLTETDQARRIRNPPDPLAALDRAIAQIDSKRSELGALDNRLEAVVDNLGEMNQNLTAARSRILDADYAVEVANMTRAQILQQAGTTVLAQANQVPQNVLSLLE